MQLIINDILSGGGFMFQRNCKTSCSFRAFEPQTVANAFLKLGKVA